jgi:hypothetical protein
MAKVRANKNEACNSLKLRCKMNNVFVCYILDSGMTNLLRTSHAT